MIISLKIENFRSIKETLIVDLTTEKRLKETDLPNNSFIQNENELLKSFLLYGRNASGKSNVLLALKALSFLIVESDSFKHEDKLGPYEPFLFDEDYVNKPVKFEIDFISVVSKLKYKYILSYNATEIFYEALYVYPLGVRAKLYERHKKKISYGDYYKGPKKKIESDLLSNQLFLSKSATSNVKYLDECYIYFSRYIYVSTIHDTEYDKAIIRSFSELFKNDNKLKSNMLELLKAADTSISDFKIIENEKEIKFSDAFPDDLKKQILERHKYEVRTTHSLFENGEEVGKTTLDIENESFGTKKTFCDWRTNIRHIRRWRRYYY